MAIMIPDACPDHATNGERTVFKLFRDEFPDDFTVWYEPIVRGRYPDFIALSKDYGLLVLECKSWTVNQIKAMSDTEVELELRDKDEPHIEKVPNPIRQVRDYHFNVTDRLKESALLRHAEGEYQGKLLFPIGYGVIFTQITQSQANAHDWGSFFAGNHIIFSDELKKLMGSYTSDRDRIARLRRMQMHDFTFEPLTSDQCQTINGLLHREVKVRKRRARAESTPKGVAANAEVIEVLDAKQEQTAKSIGSGHRIFAGVAGSGKTLLLIARAKLLAQESDAAKILFLCFNRALGTYVREQFTGEDSYRNVEVYTFHAWAIQRTNVRKYPSESFDEYSSRLLAALLHQSEQSHLSSRYHAIMIDEGQDFEPDWFKCCAQSLRPDGDLVIAVDGAQSLYGRSQKFTWASVGIQAQGRSRRLTCNYRNTKPILDLAWHIGQATSEDETDEDAIIVVSPDEVTKSGTMPQFQACTTEGNEHVCIIKTINMMTSQGYDLSDIAILYPRIGGHRIPRLVSALSNVMDVVWISDKDNQSMRDRFMNMPGVRIITMHGSKGLEFPVVILAALDQLPYEDEASERNLLYVGMTRCTSHLFMTWVGKSAFTESISESDYAQPMT